VRIQPLNVNASHEPWLRSRPASRDQTAPSRFVEGRNQRRLTSAATERFTVPVRIQPLNVNALMNRGSVAVPPSRMRVNLRPAKMQTLHGSCPGTNVCGSAKSRGRGRVRVLQHRSGLGKHRRPSRKAAVNRRTRVPLCVRAGQWRGDVLVAREHSVRLDWSGTRTSPLLFPQPRIRVDLRVVEMRTLHGSRPGTNVSDNAKSRIAGECVCFSTALDWERTEDRPRKAAVNRRTRAPVEAYTQQGESPCQAERSPACKRRLLRRGNTRWGAAGGEQPVRNNVTG